MGSYVFLDSENKAKNLSSVSDEFWAEAAPVSCHRTQDEVWDFVIMFAVTAALRTENGHCDIAWMEAQAARASKPSVAEFYRQIVPIVIDFTCRRYRFMAWR